MGIVPSNTSIENSISYLGGNPSNSSGNTSGYSLTIKCPSTLYPASHCLLHKLNKLDAPFLTIF